MPGIIGSTGRDRSSAWIWLFSSTHSTTAFSGGLWYSPTTSMTFSTNSGSVDSLKVSLKCGFRPKSRQMRPMVDFDSPHLLAIKARDQWVASVGASSSVATTTASTWSMVIVAGRPGRSSSTSPSRRCATNRPRHLLTVATWQCRRSATSVLFAPSAEASTILHRNANAWEDFARLDQRSSVARSSSLSTNSALGLPVLAMLERLAYLRDIFTAQDTRVLVQT